MEKEANIGVRLPAPSERARFTEEMNRALFSPRPLVDEQFVIDRMADAYSVCIAMMRLTGEIIDRKGSEKEDLKLNAMATTFVAWYENSHA